jgi:hypothetical protein
MTKPRTPDAKVRSIFDAAIAKGFRLGTDGKEFYYNAPRSDPETDELMRSTGQVRKAASGLPCGDSLAGIA